MRSVQTERSTHSQFLGGASPVCLVVSNTSTGTSSLPIETHASTFLCPLAPRALPRFLATTGTLTPARRVLRASPGHERPPVTGQVSLVHSAQPSRHSATTHLARPAIAFLCCPPSVTGFPETPFRSVPGSGLHLESGGSPRRTAESCSLACGLPIRLRLLPTPSHDDAVTFSYRDRASPGRGLPPLRSRLLPGARIPASAGMTART